MAATQRHSGLCTEKTYYATIRVRFGRYRFYYDSLGQ
jgi:hypothetical protein